MLTVLVVLLLIFIIAGSPPMGFHRYGWGPSGVLTAVLVVLVVWLLLGGRT